MAAESSGINVIEISREDDQTREFYASSKSNIRLEGSYPRFLKLVEMLTEMSPACPPENLACGGPLHSISKVTLRERGEGNLRIEFDLELFRYLSEEEYE